MADVSHTRRTLQCSWDRILVLILMALLAALLPHDDTPTQPVHTEEAE
ncbi:hypothetical protein [Mameliella alba]|uniref:Uncharacterized protein n=1 Tax=Mameliella alba TaxID=561184 RepID=A0A0B3S0Y2_9RHOB|nr:hypothetical protein [Mameliella alba]KHQ50271.1 hypothetical protein OA50_05119 [Mameliella alba]PTR37309.1 hypothetical protein LX94_03648 [Mameliella alba]GGF73703.1 hypothetical protein GCM10011319_37800 [Mameliella alba]SDD76104.1 hypothetical protein SAMN05216376_111115 [Mameliella alba]